MAAVGRPRPTEEVLELALGLGFDTAGIAPLRPPQDAERFRAWLKAGRAADMTWLEQNQDRILDPRLLLPGGGSLLVVGLLMMLMGRMGHAVGGRRHYY